LLHQLSGRAKAGILISIISGMFLAALDQTIVGTALPKILSELKGFTEYSWVVAAYMIAQAIAAPITSKLSDIYGRKVLFFFNVIIFLIGSVLAGMSHSMTWLIASRAIQGIGGGGLAAMAFTIIADIFPPRERGKWSGLIGAIFGLASVVGPTLGGYLTDHLSWRWVFYVNLPVGAIAMAIAAFALPNIKHDLRGKIDWLGAVMLSGAVIPLILGLVWGGVKYAWSSPEILGLFGTAAVFTALLLPFMVGIVVSSIISGQITSRTGRYRIIVLVSLAIATFALFLLSRITRDTTNTTIIRDMVILGLGIGPSLPLLPMIAQNFFGLADIGVVTGATTFFRTIGGAVGTAVLGTIFNNQLTANLRSLPTTGLDQAPQLVNALRDPNIVTSQPALAEVMGHIPAQFLPLLKPATDAYLELAKASVADAIAIVFTVAMGLGAASLVLFYLVEEHELRSHQSPEHTTHELV
jgi:multidrug resistance protein